MNKTFNSIAFEIPEGFYPSYYEMEGRFIRIYLTEKNPLRFEITPPEYFDKKHPPEK